MERKKRKYRAKDKQRPLVKILCNNEICIIEFCNLHSDSNVH